MMTFFTYLGIAVTVLFILICTLVFHYLLWFSYSGYRKSLIFLWDAVHLPYLRWTLVKRTTEELKELLGMAQRGSDRRWGYRKVRDIITRELKNRGEILMKDVEYRTGPGRRVDSYDERE